MPSQPLTLQNYTPIHLDKLAAFLERYRQACPDAKLTSAEVYTYHPALENGQNVFCVFDDHGQIRGFAPLFPAPVGDDAPPGEPHHIWMVLLADPGYEAAVQARELLLGPVLERAHILAALLPPKRPTRLACDLMISQQTDIIFLERNSFERYDGTYVMQRSCVDPIPDIPLPTELSLKHWKLTSVPEQEQYIRAYNQAFPTYPRTLEALKFFLNSPSWSDGTAIAAFDPRGELVASILVYPREQGFGITDDVFVLPAWRGRDIAKALIAEGLRYLRDHDFTQVILEVLQRNLPAVSVYRSMGYKMINEEVFLGRFL
jgi:GNAT superfamily N-acetyltransferase